MPIELSPPGAETSAREPRSLSEYFSSSQKVSSSDRMFFTEQLALLLDTGVNLHAALEGLSRQVRSPALRRVIDTMCGDVAGGRSFSQALALHPEVFSTTYVNLIAASEGGGFMPAVLEQIHGMEDRSERLRRTLTSAFSYPAFLLAFSLAVVIFVLVVVFPKFEQMFASIADQLPPSTMLLMSMSDILRHHWYLVLGALVATGWGALLWARSPAGKATVDRVKLEAPVLKTVFVQLYLVQSLRVIGLSLAHGVSVVDTLAACRDVVNNSVFQRFLGDVERRVQEGAGLASGFNQARFIPPLVRQMITTGEETGNLARVMSRVADFYEAELEARLVRLSKMVEPLMLLVMGAVVGLLVASLILPIFKRSRAVG